MEDDTVTFFSAGGEGGIYLFSFQRTGTWQWWRVGSQDVIWRWRIYRIQNRAEAVCAGGSADAQRRRQTGGVELSWQQVRWTGEEKELFTEQELKKTAVNREAWLPPQGWRRSGRYLLRTLPLKTASLTRQCRPGVRGSDQAWTPPKKWTHCCQLKEKKMLAMTYPLDHAGLIMTHYGDCF